MTAKAKISLSAIATILSILVTYFMIAFLLWDLNPVNWNEGRFILIVIAGVFIFLSNAFIWGEI